MHQVGDQPRLPISPVISVPSFLRIHQHGSHWTDFREIWYWGTFTKKFVEEVRTWLNSCKNIGNFTVRPKCVLYCWQRHTYELQNVPGIRWYN